MKRTLRNDQSGMVAIMITMIMMFVITLIVLGFAENTRRNQRESLDTQLGMQAYYAAETGVNTVTKILNGLPAGTDLAAISTCGTYYGTAYPRPLNPEKTVANTCLMVNPTPASMETDGISASGESVVWDVENAASRVFESLSFSWLPDVGGTSTACNSPFRTYPTTSAWNCDRAVLRVDILRADVQTSSSLPGSLEATTLAANTATLYMQPTDGTQQGIPIKTFNSTSNNNITAYQGACNIKLPNGCSVTVSLDPAARASKYYVRITALYGDAKSVRLTGVDSVGATQFKNGQVVVDSTGRAQDQLKRIRVRIPLTPSGDNQPTNAVQSAGSTCKDILIAGAGAGVEYRTGACANNIWPL